MKFSLSSNDPLVPTPTTLHVAEVTSKCSWRCMKSISCSPATALAINNWPGTVCWVLTPLQVVTWALTFETQEQLMCPERAAFTLFLQVGCLKRGAAVQWVRKLHCSLVYLVVVYLNFSNWSLIVQMCVVNTCKHTNDRNFQAVI